MREANRDGWRGWRKTLPALLVCVVSGFSIGFADAQPEKFRMLVLNQMGAWMHTGAINGLKPRLDGLALAMGFGIKHVDANTDSQMVPDTLNRYQVIFLNNNTSLGNVIHAAAARAAFKEWLQKGNGVVAIHEVSDHADLWPWFTDSVFSGTRFTQHSGWNSSAGKNAKVKWDDIPVEGEVRANKSEYAQLKSGTPGSSTGEWFTYPDSWDSFTINPRDKVDVLMRIDESSFDVPERMGTDHPIAWAYHLPPLYPGARQGRFIYSARGHEAPAYSGTGTGAAPNDVWGNDNSPTYNFIRWSICWAAGASWSVDEQCTPGIASVRGSRSQAAWIKASGRNGILTVTARGAGRFDVGVYDVAGHRLARAEGAEGEFTFPGLKRPSMYFVKVRDGAGQVRLQHIAL